MQLLPVLTTALVPFLVPSLCTTLEQFAVLEQASVSGSKLKAPALDQTTQSSVKLALE